MEKLQICDSHNDFLTELNFDELEPYILDVKSKGVKRICASYWPTKKDESLIQDDLKQRACVLRNTDSNFLLHIEDLFWIKDESSLNFLTDLKPFSCSLTWNKKNDLACGAHEKGGLTEWGKYCVGRLEQNGIVIDTAHLNRQSFYEFIKNKKHIYCSHTGFYGVRRHKRNLTDKQVDLIVKSDGYIGLFFYDGAIKPKESKSFSIQDIVTNVKYFTSRWGYDNLGIGSDFYGIEDYPKGLKVYDDFKNLAFCLEIAGFSSSQIEKIFYKNFENFYKKMMKK